MKKHPLLDKLDDPKVIFGGMTATWLACSLLFMVLEDQNFLDSLYWGVTTAVTVGYGDLSPSSGAGKVIAIVLMLSMVLFFLPMIVVLVISRLYDDKNEFTHEEQEQLKTLLQQVHDDLANDGR